MRDEVYDAVLDLVDEYQLHRWPYVTLTPLNDLFPIHYANLKPFKCLGSCTMPESGVMTPTTPARISIAYNLSTDEERVVYAHEIGHAIRGHSGDFPDIEASKWFLKREERQAWEVAAVLLVPLHHFSPFANKREIATTCGVPPNLVTLAIRVHGQTRGYF